MSRRRRFSSATMALLGVVGFVLFLSRVGNFRGMPIRRMWGIHPKTNAS